MKKFLKVCTIYLIIIFMSSNSIDAIVSASSNNASKGYTMERTGTVISLNNASSVDLPTLICNNKKVKKIIISKDMEQLLSEEYYELDPSLMQNYSSITPNCPNISDISVDKSNKYFTCINGVLYNKEKTELYYCPPGKTGELVIPEGVRSIGTMAFQECSKLTSISFPSTLKIIGQGAFGSNTSLIELIVSSNNEYFKADNNVIYRKDGEELVVYAGGNKNKTFTIPEGVKAISSAAFMGCANLQELCTNKNLISVGKEAFRSCTELKKVHFETGLHDIYAGAFYRCSKLQELNLPEGARDVYEDALTGCTNLLTIEIPGSIQTFACDLLTVPYRTIKIYNPYLGGLFFGNAVAKGINFYCYKDSYTSKCLFEKGCKVNFFKEDYAPITAGEEAPNSAVKGTGFPDTSWFDWNKSTLEISNPDQLAGLAILVSQYADFSQKTVVLKNDLDLSCYPNWRPIGGELTRDGLSTFNGSFNGNRHIIYNLRINRIDSSYQGLFGNIYGEIKNLAVKNAEVIGDSNVAILLASASNDTLSNCSVSGTVYGCENVGGLAGISSIIECCSVDAEIHGITNVGGITGISMNHITKCTSSGRVIGNNIVGGISGMTTGGTIEECINSMIVTGDSSVGGILGEINKDTIVSSCTNKAEITGVDRIGGIIGDYGFDGTAIECFNVGKVTGAYYVGGIAGCLSLGIINQCTNSGEISGFSGVGGILGHLGYVDPEYERVITCRNTGKIHGNHYAGDIVGKSMFQ